MTDILDELRQVAAVSPGGGQASRILAGTSGNDVLDQVRGTAEAKMAATSVPSVDVSKEIAALNDSIHPAMKPFIGMGRGFTNIGRAVGLVEPENPTVRQAGDDLEARNISAMGGKVMGEALPFVPLTALAGAGLVTTAGKSAKVIIPAAEKLLTRFTGSAMLGALEGAAVAKGQSDPNDNKDDTDRILASGGVGGILAGATEVVFPVLGRMGHSLFRRLKRTPKGDLFNADGTPTDELLEALDEVGMTYDELEDQAVDYIVKNQDILDDTPEALRKVRFEEFDIPYTKGDITQDFTQQGRESRLSSMAIEDGEPLRQLKADQSNRFELVTRDFAEGLGDPSEAGRSIKQAAKSFESSLRDKKNALYSSLESAFPGVTTFPFDTKPILDALPNKANMRRFERMEGTQIKAFKNLLVEFGIDKSPEAVEAFQQSGGEVIRLNLGNMEEFRQAIRSLQRADSTGVTSAASGDVLRSLDVEADLLDQSLKAHGVDSGLDVAKQARSVVRQMKTDFSSNSLAGRLINTKPDGVTPIIEASQAVKELSTKPIEQFEKTMKVFIQNGDKGRKAIKDMRAAVVMQALEDSLSAPSRKTSGIQTIDGNRFYKSLRKFGDDRLELLFRGDKQAASTLKKLQQVALDTEAAAGATVKGSAPVNLEIVKRLARTPLVSEVVNAVGMVVTKGHQQRGVAKAANAKVTMRRFAPGIQAQFPLLAAYIGTKQLTSEDEENAKNR